jgi:transposase
MPRPTKLTAETRAKIVSAVRAGNYIEVAAAYAGVSRATLYKWLQRGARARPGTLYRQFVDALGAAQVEAEVRNVALVAKAAERGEWTAAAWWCERKLPGRWSLRPERFVGAVSEAQAPEADGSRQSHEVTITWDLKQLSSSELWSLRALAFRAVGAPGTNGDEPTPHDPPSDDPEPLP